jgi:hypothetical protein
MTESKPDDVRDDRVDPIRPATVQPHAPTAPIEVGPPSPVQRVSDGVVWSLGIFTLLFLGRAWLLFDPAADLSGFERGQVVGRIAGAVLTGAVVRWVWVRLRKRGRVLSPWILVVATLLLVSSLTRSL